ncbi:Ig-like domain-containing protein [Clostridium hydrogenum]|uniref:Ig-like domain-containing protein n=1 Tax=Clostridium hydrogenum TaxID=2855764 RepID=UPI001F3A4803|nr:hypothetical protein [Clostridium hydrogenum]
MRKKNFLRRVSLGLMLSFLASQIYCIPNVKAESDNTYPYNVSPDSTYGYLIPQTYYGHAILADEYTDTPAHKQTPGANDADGWAFHQTVMFPANYSGTDTPSISNMHRYYNGSITGEQAMESAGYGINITDDTDSHYYLNWKFGDMLNPTPEYDYSSLIYYREVDMYKDSVRIPYQVDSKSFQSTSAGATVWQDFPSYTTCRSGTDYVHDYHLSTVTAYPQHIKPTADFYFNSGDATESVNPGQTVNVTDGNNTDTYDDTSSLYWSAYTDMSNKTYLHGTNHALPQSYAYDDAIIVAAGWSIYDSNGNNVNSEFHTQLGPQDKEGAATNFSFTVDGSITPGTYTVHHSVTDNWGSSSQDQTRTFTVSPPQQHKLTVHYIDQAGSEISGTKVDNALNPYTPVAPNGYSLTGNYRTSANGTDTAYNGSINVDLSSSNQTIYVVCSSIISQSELNAHYVDVATGLDITDVNNVSNPYTPHAPQGYSLTGNYRTSSTGTDIPYTTNIAPVAGVSDVYVMCNKVNSEYTLNVMYVDENNNNNTIGYGDTVYYDDTSPNLKHSNGSEFTTYLPDASKTPAGYTLDTSKYFDPALGYFIQFDSPASSAGTNGQSIGKTVNLQVYCISSGGNVNPTPTPEPTPAPVNNPPTVTLNLPPTVALGDDLPVNAVGNDSDGDTLTYSWNTPSGMTGDLSGIGGTVQFDNPSDVGQEKTFTVTVNDGKGGTATATATTKVVEPQPTVSIIQSGTFKENRKVTLSETSYSGSKSYTIDNTKTEWSFYDSNNNPITVTNTADSGLVESLDSITGTSSMNVLFTKAGTYTVKCTVYNNYGSTATDTKQITIVPDLAPIADFTVPSIVYRDPNNNNLGTTTLIDNSSSQDGDSIDKRVWFYCFDSNNNGSDEDDEWYVYQNNEWTQFGSYADVMALVNNPSAVDAINSGNLTTVQLTPENFNRDGQMQSHVGDYYFKEIVREKFGQPTISNLVTIKDCKISIKN